MTSKFSKFIYLGCVGLVVASTLSVPAVAAGYKATAVGFSNQFGCTFQDMSNHGQVVGGCYYPRRAQYLGFATYGNGRYPHRVDGFDGGTTEVRAANDRGVIVGWSFTSNPFGIHAFVKTPGVAINDLGTLGGTFSEALAINRFGLISGDSTTAGDAESHAFIIRPRTDTLIDIGSLGGCCIFPWRINDHGVVAGYGVANENGFDVERGFYAKPPNYQLVPLRSDGGSRVNSINEAGVMVGSTTIFRGYRAFIATTTANTLSDLGTPVGTNSEALGINDLGRVVGYAQPAGFVQVRAFTCSGNCSDFVYLDGVTAGLPAGEELTYARRITNAGVIFAESQNLNWYLLTPQ